VLFCTRSFTPGGNAATARAKAGVDEDGSLIGAVNSWADTGVFFERPFQITAPTSVRLTAILNGDLVLEDTPGSASVTATAGVKDPGGKYVSGLLLNSTWSPGKFTHLLATAGRDRITDTGRAFAVLFPGNYVVRGAIGVHVKIEPGAGNDTAISDLSSDFRSFLVTITEEPPKTSLVVSAGAAAIVVTGYASDTSFSADGRSLQRLPGFDREQGETHITVPRILTNDQGCIFFNFTHNGKKYQVKIKVNYKPDGTIEYRILDGPYLRLKEAVPITIRCRARSPMEDWRGNNFILAAKQLNADLEAAGDPRRVEVVINQDNINWGDYVTEFVLSYGAGEEPDIWLTGHEYIGVQAEAGRIIALDALMKEFPGFENVIDNLWDSTSYKGEIWGVPQDAEALPLYFNKTLLSEVGWTADEIEALPGRIEQGEFTLYDMLETAKEAVDKGIVPDGNGFWTHPKNGPGFTAFYYAFGGETIDAATGKLVFDEEAGLKYYQFFYDAAQTYGSMGCLGLGWGDAWHPGVSGSKVLFWIGGTWHWAEWAEHYLQELGGEDYMWETFGFALIPAAEQGGQPNTLTHTLAYLISSQSEHPDLALALIAKVTNDEPNTRHAVASTHLGILKSQTEYEPYAEARFLSETLYMLDYTTFLPNAPYWGSYFTITYEALAAVVGGTFTPQEAVEFVVDSLQRELGEGENVIIR